MRFIEIKTHKDINKAGFFYFSFTYFDGCQAEAGGAIYCTTNSNIAIISCIFKKCKASSGSGRGSAIGIERGNTICQYTCIVSCNSSFGGDIFIAEQAQSMYFIEMQVFHSIVKYHPSFFACPNQEIKYSNWSSTIIRDSSYSYYGTIFCLSNVKNLKCEYINGYKCEGQQSILSIEHSSDQSITISNINAFDNIGSKYVIGFWNVNSVSVLLTNSNFCGNNELINYYYLQSSASQIVFQKCSFSLPEISTSNVQFDNQCEFNQIPIYFQVANKCFQKIVQTIHCRNFYITKMFVFVIILSINM